MKITRLMSLFAILFLLMPGISLAQTLTNLHSFTDDDGSRPSAGLLLASDGNFYGTTTTGGDAGYGNVFQITPSGQFTALYNFVFIDQGQTPMGKLVQAKNGSFYGTTSAGGNDDNCDPGCGLVFQFTTAGYYNVIYTFNGTDGTAPLAGLIQAKDNYLYGTTSGGGTHNYGTVFKVSQSGTFTSLYSFCAQTKCADGSHPAAALLQASDTNLYGTTQGGGGSLNCNGGCGTVFKLTTSGVLTVLHSFTKVDGSAPLASLIQATDGNLYGTTSAGGAHNSGTVFKIGTSGTFSTLFSFCAQSNCTDGITPSAALLQAKDGNLYGTAAAGGSANVGVIFRITPAGQYTVLYSFTGSDGQQPMADLVQGTDGNFYGTTALGGDAYLGSIFSFSSSGMQFVPVTPCRVVDTRNPAGPFGGPYINGNSSRDFLIPQGACKIPAAATAYSLNATIIPHGPLGYITLWPTGVARPLVSTMNSYDARVKADAVILPAGTSGGVSVYASNPTDVVIDVNGYFEPAAQSTLTFYPVTPCRVVDTRNPPGGLGGPYIIGKTSRSFPILSGGCQLPNGALAYSMNFTAVPHGPLGYLTVWPSDQPQPYVSTLNAYAGGATANAAIVPAAVNGDISAYVSNDSDLVIDVNGYFAAPGAHALSLYTVTPCRLLDTRPYNTFEDDVQVTVQGSPCPVPKAAQAYVFNATVIPQQPLGYLSLWADSEPQPLVSTLNAYDGAVASNMAIVPTVNGLIDAFASDMTDLLLDITSYFAP